MMSNNPDLSPLIRAAFPDTIDDVPHNDRADTTLFWDESFFRLNNVRAFQALSPQRKTELLWQCCDDLLEEAYSIEKAGMEYGARMILLSKSDEEQVLYCATAAEEAAHLELLLPFISESSRRMEQPFVTFLRQVIAARDKASLIFIVQVLLEGWGIIHYRALAYACRNTKLATVLRRIAKDETRHHRGGEILSVHYPLSNESEVFVMRTLQEFFRMIQIGPQRVVARLQQTVGRFTQQDYFAAFEEMGTEEDTANKLATLGGLMATSKKGKELLDKLAAEGLLRPFTAQECAKFASA